MQYIKENTNQTLMITTYTCIHGVDHAGCIFGLRSQMRTVGSTIQYNTYNYT